MKNCTTCNRPANAPYRRIVKGAIVEGCVAKDHNGQLPTPTNTSAWHNRKAAKKIRRDSAAWLREMLA